MQLIHTLKRLEIIQYGHFTLKSGQFTHCYLNFKKAIQHPQLMSDLCHLMVPDIQPLAIVGVPQGAVPYASILSYITKQPLLMLRDNAKTYGTKSELEGYAETCVLIEDVITTGQSVMDCITRLSTLGVVVKQVVCLVDREMGGTQMIEAAGYPVVCMFKLSDLCDPLITRILEIKHQKKSRVIASLDVEESRLYELMDRVGPYVCGIKLHRFLYPNLDVDKIIALKEKHQLFIIEDAKLADIPVIAQKYVNQFKDYADAVTVHGLVGQHMLDLIDMGILIVYQMTSANNLFNSQYQQEILELKSPRLIGYISPVKVPGFLTFTTGVNHHCATDGHAQQYQTPAEIISDFIIVGRGLFQDGEIEDNIKHYL